MGNFIPSFHFVNPADKSKPEWCKSVKDYYYLSTSRQNLLHKKNVAEINAYATGDFSMTPFKRMFKSMRKKIDDIKAVDANEKANRINNLDTIGIEWSPLGLIPNIMNSAIANIYKIPVDSTCVAQDGLAMKKRKEDIEYLKAKPEIESELQPIADEMGIGEVDLGPTKNSSVPFSRPPMDMDLSDPEQEDVFTKLFYSLRVETAFEKAIKQFYNLKNGDIHRMQWIRDNFYYGVSCADAYTSSMTGLPDLDYIHPSRIETEESDLQDYSDNTCRVIDYSMTVDEMFNYFSDDIADEKALYEIINGNKTGYCDCNNIARVDEKNFNSFTVNVKQFQVKTVDWVGVIKKKKSKYGYEAFTTDESKADYKIWGQNVYTFFWMYDTNYFFKITKVPYSFRKKGKEAFQSFPSVIYRSQKKSAVELCISENKKAQIAEIKLQHLLIKSAPPGKYIDLRFLRNALEGLKNEERLKYTMDDLINLAFEHNHFIGDTEGFDGKNDGQIKPFMDIPGGLKDEARGYLSIILSARQNIAYITGINENLTGMSSEELVGLQQLRINSGLNAISYCNEAIKYKMEALSNIWASLIQSAIEKGGQTKKALISMIGIDDANLIDALDEAPLHDLTIRVDIGQRYYEMQAFQSQLLFLKQKGVVGTVDEYLLNAIDNPKEKFQKLYFIEERWKKEQAQARQEQMANMQAIEQNRSQTELQKMQLSGENEIKKIYSKGDVESKLMQLGSELDLSYQRMDGIIRRALQRDRGRDQLDKNVKTIQAKKETENQRPIL